MASDDDERNSEETCRGCLTSYNLRAMERDAIFNFLEITSIVITQQSFLCFDCLTRLNNAKEFREECLRTDVSFRDTCNKRNISKNKTNKSKKRNGKYTKTLSDRTQTESLLINYEVFREKVVGQRKKKIVNNNSNETDNYDDMIGDCDQYGIVNSSQNILDSKNIQDNNEDDNPMRDISLEDECLSYIQIPDRNDSNNEESDDIKDVEKICDEGTVKETELNDYPCKFCNKRFRTKALSECHELLHSVRTQRLPCPVCSKVVSRTRLMQHIDSVHHGRSESCTVCHKSLLSENIKKHMLLHAEKRFRCEICDRSFVRNYRFVAHQKLHSADVKKKVSFKCIICRKHFNNDAELNAHRSTKCEPFVNDCDNPFLCVVCGKRYKSKSYLSNHIDVHHGEMNNDLRSPQSKFLCVICGKQYSSRFYLHDHTQSQHSDEPQRYLCTECGKEHSTKGALNSHITFAHRPALKRHACETCNKRFVSRYRLKVHMRIHSDERPYHCHLCSLAFKETNHLKRHLNTHTREKAYGCDVCGKFFSKKDNLVVHMRIHTGERPYVCTICSEQFIDSKMLKRHIQRTHSKT